MIGLLLNSGRSIMDSRIKRKENFVLLVEKFHALLLWPAMRVRRFNFVR